MVSTAGWTVYHFWCSFISVCVGVLTDFSLYGLKLKPLLELDENTVFLTLAARWIYTLKDIMKVPNKRNPLKPFGLMITHCLSVVFVVPMLKSSFWNGLSRCKLNINFPTLITCNITFILLSLYVLWHTLLLIFVSSFWRDEMRVCITTF